MTPIQVFYDQCSVNTYDDAVRDLDAIIHTIPDAESEISGFVGMINLDAIKDTVLKAYDAIKAAGRIDNVYDTTITFRIPDGAFVLNPKVIEEYADPEYEDDYRLMFHFELTENLLSLVADSKFENQVLVYSTPLPIVLADFIQH